MQYSTAASLRPSLTPAQGFRVLNGFPSQCIALHCAEQTTFQYAGASGQQNSRESGNQPGQKSSFLNRLDMISLNHCVHC